jgi:hypothetical protein
VLARAINSEIMTEEIRSKLAEEGFSLRGLFDKLDWLQRGYLTGSELRRYFDNYPGETEAYRKGCSPITCLEGLIRRFNKDKLNGRISLPEFLDELTPKFT